MVLLFALRGTYTPEMVPLIALALASSLGAAQLGLFTFRRLSDGQFRWLIITLMTLSGALLLARTLF
jgi:uncharacterized membrane protein YfcA